MTTNKYSLDLANLETPTDRLVRESVIDRWASVGINPTLERTIDEITRSTLGIVDSSIFENALKAQEAFARLAEPYGGVAEMWSKLAVQDQLARQVLEHVDTYQKLDVTRT